MSGHRHWRGSSLRMTLTTMGLALAMLWIVSVSPAFAQDIIQEGPWTGNFANGTVITKENLVEILKLHDKWLKSDGKEGRRANLTGANLSKADLSGASLSRADLSGANLFGANLMKAWFEPKPGAVPYIPSLQAVENLSSLTFRYSPQGLIELREALKKAGLLKQEREITYAIKRTQRQMSWNEKGPWWKRLIWKAESVFHLIMFEIPCAYGMRPGRPILILLALIPLCSALYMLALRARKPRTGIWVVRPSDRVLKGAKDKPALTKLTTRVLFRPLPSGGLKRTKMRISRCVRVVRLGFYFSLLSAFSIGWRELNVGSWITRLQRREYTLRATGWVRTVPGLQSLISVYLLALWALTYFGRPFE